MTLLPAEDACHKVGDPSGTKVLFADQGFEVVSYDTEFIIDVRNFSCMRKGECQTRTLSIDAGVYATLATDNDKRTATDAYTCTLELPDGDHATLVSDYSVVGAFDLLEVGASITLTVKIN